MILALLLLLNTTFFHIPIQHYIGEMFSACISCSWVLGAGSVKFTAWLTTFNLVLRLGSFGKVFLGDFLGTDVRLHSAISILLLETAAQSRNRDLTKNCDRPFCVRFFRYSRWRSSMWKLALVKMKRWRSSSSSEK